MKTAHEAHGFVHGPLGYEIRLGEAICLFGHRHSSLDSLKAANPSWKWARVRQTHSDIVVASLDENHELREADAHWTTTPGLALVIATADCIPALIVHEPSQSVAAVHAGWRGVASRIIPKTMEAFGKPAHELRVVIGPHIGFQSFEVGEDVKDELLRSVKNPISQMWTTSSDPGKFRVDLTMLVREQLKEKGLREEALIELPIDTMTDSEFHSHRRDREKAGRQLSVVIWPAKASSNVPSPTS